MRKLDVQQMLDDLGGCSAVATILGGSRSTPYAWYKRNAIGDTAINDIQNHWYEFIQMGCTDAFCFADDGATVILNLNKYMVEFDDE